VTKSTPYGSVDQPFNPLSVAIGAEATFVGRAIDTDKKEMSDVLRAAAEHRGAAFVEILQNCNIYNDMAWGILYDRESKVEHELRVEHGKPLIFGAAHARKGLVLDGLKARVVGVDEVPAERLWVHDQHDTASALVLASLASPQFPVPVGVLAQVEAPIYEDLIADQEKRAVSERGPGDIARLLTSGDTWTIR
jgi:2-oxoglutarate ferredoxin oxidoreductase subunit beta